MQAMLLTLLVGGTVAATTLVIHSKKSVRQVLTQQEQLRWADEALAAYAAAHARLPCPASRWDEDPASVIEDCTGGATGAARSVGYLPLALLPGAREMDLGQGPIRYAVATGTTTHGTTARPLSLLEDLYLPRDPLGEPVEGYADPQDESTQIRNGLDFCASLHANTHPLASLSSHRSKTRTGVGFNYAYGLVAAGPTVGNGDRFDTGLATELLSADHSALNYDDRTLVRSFYSLAQAAGCRQYAAPGPDVEPASVSLLAMDMLAASVANHVTVASFQENNAGNGKAQVNDAGFAQAVAIAGLTLNAAGLADIIISATWNSIDAVRSVITCIASLGTLCFEVPFKAAGVVGSVLAVSSSIVALALNSASMIPVSMALDANVKARDRAVQSAKPPVKSVEDAREKIRATLYGSIQTYCKTRFDATTNAPVIKFEDGKQVVDEHGGIVYECDEVTEFVPGMDKDVESAREQEDKLVAASRVYQANKLDWFNDSRILYRVDQDRSHSRYFDRVCRNTGSGLLIAGCSRLPSGNETGGHDWVNVFKSDLARTHAIAKRTFAEAWARAFLDVEDAENDVDQKQKDLDGWKDLVKLAEGDATATCRRANSNDPAGQQICRNSLAQVQYMQTCTYRDKDNNLYSELSPPGGGGPNMDAQCTPVKDMVLGKAKAVLRTTKDNLGNAQRAYENQVSPYLTYPADWTSSMVKADASVPSFEWVADGQPHYFQVGTQGSNGYHLAQDVGKEGGKPCGKLINGSFQVASQCSRYPYSRAYLDWIRADEAADKAKASRIELEAQFEKLKKEYEQLQAAAAPGGAAEETLAVGADAILRKADSRGAVGPGNKERQ